MKNSLLKLLYLAISVIASTAIGLVVLYYGFPELFDRWITTMVADWLMQFFCGIWLWGC